MRMLCQAFGDEYSSVQYLIVDWSEDLIARLQTYQAFIKGSSLLNQGDFHQLSFWTYDIILIDGIDEGEACDGLIQAKWQIENEGHEFVLLVDSIDVEKGVTNQPLGYGLLNVDDSHVQWQAMPKHGEGNQYVETSALDIPSQTESRTQ